MTTFVAAILFLICLLPPLILSTPTPQHPIHHLQQTTRTPEWHCNSLKLPDTYSADQCLIAPSCTLRNAQCMVFDSTPSTLKIADDSICAAISTKPTRIRADCSQAAACSSLQCVAGQGECVFDAAQTVQPWFCQCSNQWTGDKCDQCTGTPSISQHPDLPSTLPITHAECSHSGAMISIYDQTFNPSTSQLSTAPNPRCGCQCSSFRPTTSYPVPHYTGTDCSCRSIFITLTFSNTTFLSQYPSLGEFQLPTPLPENTNVILTQSHIQRQTQLRLLIEDIGLPLSQIDSIPSSLAADSTPLIKPYLSTTNIADQSSLLQYSIAISICPTPPAPFTTQQQPLDEIAVVSLFEAYLQHANAIIYSKSLFPDPPTLSLLTITTSTPSTFAEPVQPPNNSPTGDRPDIWVYNTYDVVSGVLTIILFTSAYVLAHNGILHWFTHTYLPEDAKQTIDVFSATYTALLLESDQKLQTQRQTGAPEWVHLNAMLHKLDSNARPQQYASSIDSHQSLDSPRLDLLASSSTHHSPAYPTASTPTTGLHDNLHNLSSSFHSPTNKVQSDHPLASPIQPQVQPISALHLNPRPIVELNYKEKKEFSLQQQQQQQQQQQNVLNLPNQPTPQNWDGFDSNFNTSSHHSSYPSSSYQPSSYSDLPIHLLVLSNQSKTPLHSNSRSGSSNPHSSKGLPPFYPNIPPTIDVSPQQTSKSSQPQDNLFSPPLSGAAQSTITFSQSAHPSNSPRPISTSGWLLNSNIVPPSSFHISNSTPSTVPSTTPKPHNPPPSTSAVPVDAGLTLRSTQIDQHESPAVSNLNPITSLTFTEVACQTENQLPLGPFTPLEPQTQDERSVFTLHSPASSP